MRIENIRKVISLGGGEIGGIFDLHVESTDELPALNSELDGLKVLDTSIAVDAVGIWYKLKSDGKWYVQDGSGNAAGDEPEPQAAMNGESMRKEPEPEPEEEPVKTTEEEPEEEPEPDGGDMR